jgi:diguanylate cyclase (GGDEF)-like protein
MQAPAPTTRILYVDDDRLARSAFSIQFKRFGSKIDLAASGLEALHMVEEHGYPVVITDLRMPGMGGLELVERLHANAPDTAVIVVTGLPELDLGRDSFHDEAILAVHPKPWDVEALKEAIEKGLRYNKERTSADLAKARRAVVIGPDPSLSLTISQELESDGFVVERPALSVDEAMALVQKQPALIVVEIGTLNPPRFTALAALRQASPGSAILVLTDERSEVIARQTLAQGAADYVFATEIRARSFHRAAQYAVDRRDADRRVAELSRKDSLTGLLSHAAFREVVATAASSGQAFGVAILGLERFNAINDSLGHDAGDLFLREIGKRISSCCEPAAVARLGGDEFALMLRVDSDDALVECGNKIVRTMRDAIVLNGVEIMPTGCVGVARSRGAGIDADTLLRQCGIAMRLAKQGGRSKVHLYHESPAAAPSRLALETELRDALEKNRFILHYQPMHHLRTGLVRGAEALLRMSRPDGTLVPPGVFIPVLEDTEMIIDVGVWVLEEACRKIAEWNRAGHPDITVAVNLSARQFERDGLVQTVLNAASKAGVSPSALELEITESLLMKDTELANATLQGLKKIGTRIAIDDFGTGYSSLSYLNRFAVDVVKIDRSFVRTIGKEDSGGSIASVIIGLGHKLGLEVVGEGVETEEELAYLRNEGCDIAQGFLLGRPAQAWNPSSATLRAAV